MTIEPHNKIEDILNYSDDVYMTIDFDWIITYVNELSENLLQTSAKDLMGTDLRETLPDVVSKFYKSLSKTLKHRTPIEISKIYGPTQKNLELRSFPTESGMLIIFHDITVRENNLKTLRDSDTRHRAVLGTLSDGLISINSKGIITSFNSIAEKMFGYQESEVTGKNVSVLIPEKEREAHEEYTSYSDLNEVRIINKNRELFGLKKDGTIFPIELSVSPLNIEGHYGYIGIIHDITARKISENKILSEKEKAEKASKAKSEFISSMSHELNTPLNPIIGYSQLLEMDPELSEKHKSYVGEIHKAAKHLLNMLTDVLSFTKIYSGEIESENQSVSLTETLLECLAMLSSLIKESNINVTLKPDCYNYKLQGNAVQLREIIIHLITNAIKFNHDGGKVDVECSEYDANRVKITISDTGQGIEASQMKDLFVPFNRLGHEGSGIHGTGIGLCISKQLVESMGGEIGAESIAGKGSKFWIVMPMADMQKK